MCDLLQVILKTIRYSIYAKSAFVKQACYAYVNQALTYKYSPEFHRDQSWNSEAI